jgi:hypothetical protein
MYIRLIRRCLRLVLLCDRIVTLDGTGLKGRDGNIAVRGRLQWQEAAMTKFHDRAEAQTKQIIGQMLGDEKLVQEGAKEYRDASEPKGTDGSHDQGIVRDERGQEQPRDKERAQRVSRVDRGDDPPGKAKGN